MKNPAILIAEDEILVAKDIERSLRASGYRTLAIVSRGEDVLAVTEEKKPDLVLMDIMLKGEMDGIVTAEHMRERGIPVVFLTAHSDNGTLEKAKLSEPYGYVLKPFEDKALKTAIEMALYKHAMEMKLRDSEQWFSTTLRSIGDAVMATDTEGHVVFMNHIAEELTGWEIDDAVGVKASEVFKIFNETTEDVVENPLSRVLKEERIVGLANHTILRSKGGRNIPIDDSGSPIINQEGKLLGAVLVFRDISKRKMQERALRENEMRFRSVVESVKEGIILTAEDGTIEHWNSSAQRIFKLGIEEAVGRNISSLFPSRFIGSYKDNLKKIMASYNGCDQCAEKDCTTFEIPGICGNVEAPLEVSLSTWEANDRRYITHLVSDIVLKKQIAIEKERLIMELQDSLSRMRSLESEGGKRV